MQVHDAPLPGIKIIEPTVFGDERGFFHESFNQKNFEQAVGRQVTFVQDNHSKSAQGVLRGLHFQQAPHPQGKLVRVTSGTVFDVAVDIRPDSPTFGQWHAEVLSAENRRQQWIPEGFAHGFLVLSESAEFLYKTTDYWHPELEVSIRWDDPAIGIVWPSVSSLVLSEKDKKGIALTDCSF